MFIKQGAPNKILKVVEVLKKEGGKQELKVVLPKVEVQDEKVGGTD